MEGKVEIFLGSHNDDINCNVRSIDSVTILAMSQVVLPVSCKIAQTKFGLTEPVQSLLTQNNLVGARCLVQIHNNQCLFRVLNPGNSEVFLKPNQVIEKCHKLDSNYMITDFDFRNSTVTPDVI